MITSLGIRLTVVALAALSSGACAQARDSTPTLEISSFIQADLSSGQAADAFKRGHYALVNLLSHPLPDLMMGAELQWARRENNSDGWRTDGYRPQFSFRYSFAKSM
jgi:hypothetical protein